MRITKLVFSLLLILTMATSVVSCSISDIFNKDNNDDSNQDEGKYSVGLKYELNHSGNEYVVTGIGTCIDIDIIIPATYNKIPVKGIGDSAFKNCDEITSVIIPVGVTRIEDYAFYGCSKLKSIVIPEGVLRIDDYAFGLCFNLLSITLPDSLAKINRGAFDNCINLPYIVIPKNVAYVGSYAFHGCRQPFQILCEADSKPNGWSADWNPENSMVVWGYEKK